jgi:hypothetical protein
MKPHLRTRRVTGSYYVVDAVHGATITGGRRMVLAKRRVGTS